MYIHNYQIHNVLNVYQKQLTQGLVNKNQKSTEKSQVNSQLNYKRDRQTIIEKVSSNVLEKINLLKTNSEPKSSEKFESVIQREISKNKNIDQKKIKEFSYNIIDHNNEKRASSISVDNAEGLIYIPNETILSNKHSDQSGNQKKTDDSITNINIKV